MRSRDARLAGILLVVLGVFLVLVGIAVAWRHELEPLSSAEARCPPPADGVDGPPYAECLERESAKSGLVVAFPTLAAASGCLVAGSVIVRRMREDRQSSDPVRFT